MTIICNNKPEDKRFNMRRIYGDCLEGAGLCIPNDGYAIIDANAEVRVGDLVHCTNISGAVNSYIKQVKKIDGDSIYVETNYLEKSKNFGFEAAEILGVVKEVYDKIFGTRKYVSG